MLCCGFDGIFKSSSVGMASSWNWRREFFVKCTGMMARIQQGIQSSVSVEFALCLRKYRSILATRICRTGYRILIVCAPSNDVKQVNGNCVRPKAAGSTSPREQKSASSDATSRPQVAFLKHSDVLRYSPLAYGKVGFGPFNTCPNIMAGNGF
jgi:hypothetical protein